MCLSADRQHICVCKNVVYDLKDGSGSIVCLQKREAEQTVASIITCSLNIHK